MFSRLLAVSRRRRLRRPSGFRLSGCDRRVYCCPLMKRRSLPVRRAYSVVRPVSNASPRWRSTWHLSNRMAACGACSGFTVEWRTGFHLSSTASRIRWLLVGPNQRVELLPARLGAVCAAQPDRPPLLPVAAHEPVRVSLADRDLVDACVWLIQITTE